jgi:hypothetical protein
MRSFFLAQKKAPSGEHPENPFFSVYEYATECTALWSEMNAAISEIREAGLLIR